MNVSRTLVKYLEDLEINRVFYIPGGPLIPLSEAFWESAQLKLVCTGHECAAAFMAHGYAWSSGKLGVCCLTTGPGATNAITGVATAKLEKVPMLVITAMNATSTFSKQPAQDSTSEDGIDTVAMYRKCTLYSKMISHAGEAHQVIQNAIRIALVQKGPVHISIPTDVGFHEVEGAVLPPHKYIPKLPQVGEIEDIERAIQYLVQAKKPLMFLGYDAMASQACQEAKNLAESLAIPVITTARAKGAFPETHPLSLGVFGFASSHQALSFLEESYDVLLTVGVDFHENSTSYWTPDLQPSGVCIQIHADPIRYGQCYPGDISLTGNISAVLQQMNNVLETMSFATEDRQKLTDNLKSRVSRFCEPEKMFSQEVPIKPQRLIKEIEESFPEDTIFVVDVGNSFFWASHFLTLNNPKSFLVSTRNAAMGFSVAAIGCKSANPERPVVAIIGDGSLKMHGMEIASAINNGLPITFIVLNDSQWGSVYFGNRMLGLNAQVHKFHYMNCAKIAEALGAEGIRITQPGQIHREFITQLLTKQKTILLDVHIDSEECPPFGARIKGLSKNFVEENVEIVDEKSTEIPTQE